MMTWCKHLMMPCQVSYCAASPWVLYPRQGLYTHLTHACVQAHEHNAYVQCTHTHALHFLSWTHTLIQTHGGKSNQCSQSLWTHEHRAWSIIAVMVGACDTHRTGMSRPKAHVISLTPRHELRCCIHIAVFYYSKMLHYVLCYSMLYVVCILECHTSMSRCIDGLR